jgi:hypothetical protein
MARKRQRLWTGDARRDRKAIGCRLAAGALSDVPERCGNELALELIVKRGGLAPKLFMTLRAAGGDPAGRTAVRADGSLGSE